MANIKQITLPSGNTYDLVDAGARELIADLQNYTDYLGVTTTTISDGSTTNPITINNTSVTAKKGNIVNYGSKEFIWNGSAWQEFGDLSGLGSLAFKNSASGTYTPSGSVSAPSFTGSSSTVTISTQDNSSGNYQPKGSVSQPIFSGDAMTSTGNFTPEGSVSLSTTNKTATVSPAASGTATYTPEGTCSGTAVTLNTTTVNSITDVGSLPSCTLPSYTVANEVLTITAGNFDAGALPTKGTNTTVATSVKTVTDPTFTGTGKRLVTGDIAVPSSATFTGSEGGVSVSGTPSGTVSKPSFTGTKTQISGTVIPSGTVSQPTFTGTQATITVN